MRIVYIQSAPVDIHSNSPYNGGMAQNNDDTQYPTHTISDDAEPSEQDLLSTDPDHFADSITGKDQSADFADDADSDDFGGLYDRDEAVDEDSSAEVGDAGHPGVDEDTA